MAAIGADAGLYGIDYERRLWRLESATLAPGSAPQAACDPCVWISTA